MAVESEYQAAGPETTKLRDPYRDSRQCGILRSRREHDRRRDRPVVIDTGMHVCQVWQRAATLFIILISVFIITHTLGNPRSSIWHCSAAVLRKSSRWLANNRPAACPRGCCVCRTDVETPASAWSSATDSLATRNLPLPWCTSAGCVPVQQQSCLAQYKVILTKY